MFININKQPVVNFLVMNKLRYLIVYIALMNNTVVRIKKLNKQKILLLK